MYEELKQNQFLELIHFYNNQLRVEVNEVLNRIEPKKKGSQTDHYNSTQFELSPLAP